MMVADDIAQTFDRERRNALVVSPSAEPTKLASALMLAARDPSGLALDSLDRWWRDANAVRRMRLVLALARALPHVDAASAHRLADPRWRQALGVPLWLATFVLARRLRRRSRAANTLRAWASDWRTWRLWCKGHHLPSFNPSANQLDRFLRDFAPAHKRASTRRWGATLTAMHAAAGLPNPLDNPITREIWRAALRSTDPAAKGKARRADDDRRGLPEKQAAGLTRELLERIYATLDPHRLIDLRDGALLAVAYDALSRRSELHAIQVSDIEADGGGSGTLHIGRSKTDQDGVGATSFLRADTMGRVSAWCACANLTEGPLFRSLRGFAGRATAPLLPALDAAEVLRIVRKRVAAVDPIAARWFSGHSARVGAAQDLSAAGVPDSAIADAGRWNTITQVVRYTRKQAAKRGGMAQLARAQEEAGRCPEPVTQSIDDYGPQDDTAQPTVVNP